MPTHARSRIRLTLAAALLGVALLAAAAGSARPAVAQPAQSAPRVLVLLGGDQASDDAAIAALAGDGLEVDRGPATLSFAGNQQSLRDYDVVVALLYNATDQSRLTPQGAQTLERFVRLGGALVTGERMALTGELADLMPAIHCNSNAAASTTLTRVTPNAILDTGVPASFAVSLSPASPAGAPTETCLAPKDEAAVLYASSNGGGRLGAPGLVAWNYGQGRVAAFSTRLSQGELQSDSYRALFRNTVRWLGGARDTTPPTIRSFSVTGAGALVGERQVQISIAASDSGGSGLGSLFVREYGVSLDPADGWEQDGVSAAWQPFSAPGASFTWTLSDKPGVRYIQVFVADRAGNIARTPAEQIVNLAAAQSALAQDEVHIYRIAPGAGAATTVRMDALSGDPDLYVFLGPNLIYKSETSATPEQATFTAQGGVYQIEVAGFSAGSYRLTAQAGGASAPLAADDRARITRRPRISPTTLFPPQPPQDASTLPTAPVDAGPAGLSERLYLPLLRR